MRTQAFPLSDWIQRVDRASKYVLQVAVLTWLARICICVSLFLSEGLRTSHSVRSAIHTFILET